MAICRSCSLDSPEDGTPIASIAVTSDIERSCKGSACSGSSHCDCSGEVCPRCVIYCHLIHNNFFVHPPAALKSWPWNFGLPVSMPCPSKCSWPSSSPSWLGLKHLDSVQPPLLSHMRKFHPPNHDDCQDLPRPSGMRSDPCPAVPSQTAHRSEGTVALRGNPPLGNTKRSTGHVHLNTPWGWLKRERNQ